MSVADPGSQRAAAPSRREHGQALLLAIACAVLFLRGSLAPGAALVPHPPELFDVVRAEAVASGTYEPAEAWRGNVGMTDKYLQSLCWDRVMQDRFTDGEYPRWTRDIGGGAPFVPQMAQPFQPINLLLFAVPSVEWYGWWYLVHMTLFGWFAYAFVRRIGSAHGGALLALVAAALGMWTQCKVHHNVILTAALSLWPMLSATHELIACGARGRARRFAVGWLALWSGLSWSTGFVVIALQSTYLTGAFAIACLLRAPRGDRLRRVAPLAAGFALGGVISLANMVPILLASAESARQGQFDAARLADLAVETNQLLSAIWPDLLSWPADRFYPAPDSGAGFFTRTPLSQTVLLEDPFRADGTPFQNWVETSYAVGVVPLAAACSALFGRRHRQHAWFFALFGACAFGMASATEPFFTVAQLLPGVTVGDLRRLLFLVAMPLVVLSGLGADAWLRSDGRVACLVAGRVGLAAVATASLVALTWLWNHAGEAEFARGLAELFVRDADHPLVQQVGGDAAVAAQQFQAIAAPGELDNNYAALNRSFWVSLIAAAAGLLALWRPGRWTLPGVLAVSAAELLLTGLGPVQTVDAARVTATPKVLQPVAAQHVDDQPRPRLQRLVPRGSLPDAGLPGNVPGFLGFADAFAYNPLPPARFEEFFNTIEPGVSHSGAGVGAFEDPASLRHPLCDLYGIQFVLSRLDVADGDALVDRTPAGTGSYRLLERTTVMPRATFVRQVDLLEERDERLAALGARDRDVRARVALEAPDAPVPAAARDADAEVEVLLHDDERVVLRVRCSHDGYVRLADPYDPGWRATVDGEAATLFVADHYLRAVYVGPGEHEVVFTYDAARAVWPLRVSTAALLAALALLAASWRRR